MARDEAHAVAHRPPPVPDAPRGRNGVPIRLLLVEDERDDAELVRRALKQDGLEVRLARAATFQEARAALAEGSWDVVICDFSLCGCTGLDVLEEVRRVDREIPFILISGAIDDEQAVAAMRAGAQDYLPKGNLVRLAPAIERELAEAEHRHARYLAEERHRMLVHCSLQGLLMVQNGTVVTANQAAADILGATPDELLGLSGGELLEHVHPDDRKAFLQHPCSHSSVGERPMRVEARVIHPDEPSRWVEVSVHAMLVDGRPATQVAMVDITQRRERERELEAIATLATALRSARNREELVALLLDETLELLHADEAALASPGRTQGRADFEVARRARTDAPQSHGHETAGVRGRTPGGGKTPVVDLEPSAEGLPRSAVARRACFLAGVPLIADEAVFGVLWISRRRPIEDEDRRVLRAVGDMASSALRRVGLHEEMERRLRRLHALRAIDLAITTSHDLEMVFGVILEQVTAQLDVDAATILRVGGGKVLRLAAARGHGGTMDSSGLPFERAGLAGRVAASRKMIECPNLANSSLDSERDRALAGAGFVCFAGVPLLASGELCGVLELLHRGTLDPDEEWRGFLETVAWQVAIALDTAAMVDELRSSNLSLLQAYESTLEGWARALELRDRQTEGHTRRVAEMTVQLAREFGIEGEELVHIRRGALLHDIGKLGVPDGVLLKPGPLGEREWEIMRHHPVLAVQMLEPIPHLRPALAIPYGHHERWDGSGYPRGLKGRDISLAARLFAVVDVWDALASDRPYRAAWQQEEIVEYLRQQSGRAFDPRVVDTFLKDVLPDYLKEVE